MPNTIQIKRKTTSGPPLVNQLEEGEFCLNSVDLLLYARINGALIGPFIDCSFRKRVFHIFNDFLNTVSTAATTGDALFVTQNGTGAGNTILAAPDANSIGVVSLATGTTATGRVTITTPNNIIRLGAGMWRIDQRIWLPDLSTSVERFQLLIGFFDLFTGINQGDGAYLLYDEGGISTGGTASPNWQKVTCNNSARTFQTSSVAVVNNSWINASIKIDALANNVSYFINDVELGSPITTNIPKTAGRELGLGIGIFKNVGTSTRAVRIDYLNALNTLNFSR
jgi:hypothetical protein